MGDFVKQHVCLSFFTTADSWVILTPLEQSIKQKIERKGVPLKNWNIQINYGIKTGLNEAFIINEEKRTEILSKCATAGEKERTEQIIRPILRGKDIQRYSYNYANLYLCWIPWHFPLHLDPSIQGASKRAEQSFKTQYPALYNYLYTFKNFLEQRNREETGIRYEWYALQRWGANYWEDFNKQKIVYKEITQELSFCMADKETMISNTAYMMTSNNIKELKWLLANLNSKLFNWYYRTISIQLGTAIRMLYMYVTQISIIPFDNYDNHFWLNSLLENKEYKKIDNEIYRLYGLSTEEIEYIEQVQ